MRIDDCVPISTGRGPGRCCKRNILNARFLKKNLEMHSKPSDAVCGNKSQSQMGLNWLFLAKMG